MYVHADAMQAWPAFIRLMITACQADGLAGLLTYMELRRLA